MELQTSYIYGAVSGNSSLIVVVVATVAVVIPGAFAAVFVTAAADVSSFTVFVCCRFIPHAKARAHSDAVVFLAAVC